MIDSGKIQEIVLECLFREHEVIDGKPIVEPVMVAGITCNFGFHPGRLKENRELIKSWIDELDDKFKEGWSFVNLCYTKNNELWTGSHKTMEELMCLAIASGLMEYCADRELWSVLPSGMPYVRIKDERL